LVFKGLVALLLCAAAGANVPEETVLEDPTRPLRKPAAAAAGGAVPAGRPTLNSVLVGPDRRHAVIDGRRLAEGESHGGVRVLEIHPNRVVVSTDGSPRLVLEIANARMHKELR
jgi:hypothetical protein